MISRFGCALAFACALASPLATAGVVDTVRPGAALTSAPGYLSGPFGTPITISSDQFLVPVIASGAVDLQYWQFDASFDPSVVNVVFPADGSSGIYGARFDAGMENTLSFILAGMPDNGSGTISAVSGMYPLLTTAGVSGNGTLAYLLFEFLPGAQGFDPHILVNGNGQLNDGGNQVAEPSTLILIFTAALLMTQRRRQHTQTQSD